MEHDLHLFVPYNVFLSLDHTGNHNALNAIFCATAQLENGENFWIMKRQIIDGVHEHVCGYSNFNDIKLLLQRNNL